MKVEPFLTITVFTFVGVSILSSLAIGQQFDLKTTARHYRFHSYTKHYGKHPNLRLPGEFEKQRFLLLAAMDDILHSETIAKIVKNLEGRIIPIVLINNAVTLRQVQKELFRNAVDPNKTTIVYIDHDTKWIRDFGPTVVTSGSSVKLIDWMYSRDRPSDDNVPVGISKQSKTKRDTVPFVLEGGNLISNGAGLVVTSYELFRSNSRWPKRKLVTELARQVNATDLVVLEPLVGEDTQHVDMFATFTSNNTVIVGSYDPRVDPVNAAVLDRNAKTLSKIWTNGGRLKVVRIPMGSRKGDLWRTYTNCIYANGICFVPCYGNDDDPAVLRTVLQTYKKLLPRWKIVTLNSTYLIESGGALHCVSLNIPRLQQPLNSTNIQKIPGNAELSESDLDWKLFERNRTK